MFGFFKKKKPSQSDNPSAALRFFKSHHRIDDAYLADLLGEATPTPEISDEIKQMCSTLHSALYQIQMIAYMSNWPKGPNNKMLIGYLFGWMDVYKTEVWGVQDFNRSFFHYGFLLWFGESTYGGSRYDVHKRAMDAMMTMGNEIQEMSLEWKNYMLKGKSDALAFLHNNELPLGPAV